MRRARPLLRGALALVGEPLGATLFTSDVQALLRAAGFEPEEDTDTRDWASTLNPSSLRVPRFAYERMTLAMKMRQGDPAEAESRRVE
jgi:hypothetical protein